MVMVKLKPNRFFKLVGLPVCIFLILCPFQMLIWNFRASFCSYVGTLPHLSSAKMPCWEEVGVSFVALGILELQTARN
jgi:hypothetical protein